MISVTVIADYGNVTWRTSLARSMQVDIVNALRRGDRQQASLILSDLKHSNQALTTEDISYILEYCSNAPDPLVIYCEVHIFCQSMKCDSQFD